MKNRFLIMLIMILACAFIIFLFINIKDKIKQLKPIYNEAVQYCASQDFSNRGLYISCVEEEIKKSSIQKYNFYFFVQNFCEKLTDNLADKYICIDKIMN